MGPGGTESSTPRRLNVVSTVPLKTKHGERVKQVFPGVEIRTVRGLEEMGNDLAEIEVLITYGMDLDDRRVEEMKSLRWIQVFSAGVDRMPLATLDRRGIVVTNARGVHGPQMAEHALGIMLMHSRRLLEFARLQRERVWDRRIRVDELGGKVLGVLGTGAIAQDLAARSRAFGLTVWGHNRSGRAVDGFDRVFSGKDGLDQLLAGADYLVVLVPFTPQTRGMIGEAELRQMKSTAFLINMARGGIVDEQALLRALTEGWIAGAALDVFEQEPLPSDHPFWGLENCLLTPHISGLSPYYNDRVLEIFLKNLQVYLSGAGEWVNRVDSRKGY
ncbi:MAG: D-2-hydroxyacid dehydrogenase [Kyrpidia tusciae]|nr:D-2-hydroxyacid dehydrogenase [Kyrpidia tusciae]MBE3551905.1 D-2-hydroxyacid dehydrogenase [Kyrpidia tusciae]